MRRLLSFVAALLIPAAALAQVDRATLSGVVHDASGAVMAAATVTVTHVATNVSSRLTTNPEGGYLAVSLPSGRYLVQAEAPGFQKAAQTVLLEVGQRARLDLTLGLETASEAITVEAKRMLSTEQAALGTVVEQSAIAKLPLAIRNWDDLLVLVPGVQGDRYTEESGGTATGRTGGVNVHGSRSLQNNFLLDGVDNNTISENVQELSTQVSRPSIDSIQEFKLVTSPYSAEYGRAPGAAISVSTKSGTNGLHGTAYDFYRNDRFDSNTYFNDQFRRDKGLAPLAKPANDQNQFGGNLGGPIVKDKAFFFVDYEGTRITKGVTRITRVPTLDERNGIFTSAIKDPVTGLNFPGNVIPANRIDPIAAKTFALTPAPNTPGANNFTRPDANVEDNSDRFLGRLDVKLSNTDNVFARYVYSNRKRFIPGYFGGTIDGTGTSAWGRQTIKSQGVVTGWTKIITSSMVNEFRFSWSQAISDAVQDPFGANGPEAIGLKGVPDDPTINGGITGIAIDGYFGGGGGGRLGSPDFLPKFQHTNQFEFLDSLSWLRGNHQFKVGFDVLAPMKNDYLDIPATRGSLRFRGRFTGNPVADFLLGYVSDAQLSNLHVVGQRHWTTSVFGQDDWKVSRKLSLNLGLRWDFITPALEANNAQTNFIPGGSGTVVFAKAGSLEDRGLVKPDYNNFAPRLGIVYKLDEKTVLRGGYGIFYNIFDRVGSEDQLALNPPGLINNSVATSSTTVPLFLMSSGFPLDFLDPAKLDYRRIRIRAVDQNAPKTTIHQFSVGMQRQLADIFVVSLDLIGALGRNLADLRNLNQPLNGNGALPYPNFGFIEWREQKATSSYKGIDFSFEKRFSRGYSFNLAYTLGKSTDQSGEHLGTPVSFPQDGSNLSAWEGPSDFDIRHRVVTNFVAELPFGEGKKWANSGASSAILGGWTLSGIFTYRTGRPFTVIQGSNNVGINMTGLPNQTGSGVGPETVDAWFNVADFPAAPSGTFGNSGRNILRGPAYSSLDFSLQRRIKLSGRVGAILRWDAFNVFNRANLGLPDFNISNTATRATITSLAGDPRIMQFSLRVDF